MYFVVHKRDFFWRTVNFVNLWSLNRRKCVSIYEDGANNNNKDDNYRSNDDGGGNGDFDSGIIVGAVAKATFIYCCCHHRHHISFFYSRVIICIDLISENVLKNVTLQIFSLFFMWLAAAAVTLCEVVFFLVQNMNTTCLFRSCATFVYEIQNNTSCWFCLKKIETILLSFFRSLALLI